MLPIAEGGITGIQRRVGDIKTHGGLRRTEGSGCPILGDIARGATFIECHKKRNSQGKKDMAKLHCPQ
jgi:hypothetical protein